MLKLLLIKWTEKIITAESLMFKKMTLVQIAKDGPTGSIRKMREIGTFFP
jgi:hypothetical protein